MQRIWLYRGSQGTGGGMEEESREHHAGCVRAPVTVGTWGFTPLETSVMTPHGMRKQGSSSTHYFRH